MGQGADGDDVHARCGDGADGLEIDAAAGFELHGRPQAVAQRDCFTQRGWRHVVQQHDVDVALQHYGELFERVDLDFDERGRRVGRPRTSAHVAQYGGKFGHRQMGDVVVLDQHGIVQAHAVVGPAAARHRVLRKPAQAGQRLARVVDAGPRAGDGLDVAGGQCRDARQVRQQVQGRAFEGEDRTQRALHAGHLTARPQRRAVGQQQHQGDGRVENINNRRQRRRAAEPAGRAGTEHRFAVTIGRDEQLTGQVAPPRSRCEEVFVAGGLDQPAQNLVGDVIG